jgi:hypothetical protein
LAHRQIAPFPETGEAPLHGPALDQDMPPATATANADIRPEAVHQPLMATARMGLPQADDIAQPELDDLSLIG